MIIQQKSTNCFLEEVNKIQLNYSFSVYFFFKLQLTCNTSSTVHSINELCAQYVWLNTTTQELYSGAYLDSLQYRLRRCRHL